MRFKTLPLDDLYIEDEKSFGHVGLYQELKQVLRRDGYRFRVPEGEPATWDRVLFLNLTYWNGAEQGDVLRAPTLPADVVAHVAWHHLTRNVLARAGVHASADALLMGEAIASAFDLYLVGRLIGHSPDAAFLETQVPALADVAEAAGVSEDRFELMLQEIHDEPERAFEDLRSLLFDAGTALVACSDVNTAAAALARFDQHRFGPLLHHFELAVWVLYARAYAGGALGPDPVVRALDAELRAAPVSLDWLEQRWLAG